MSTIVPSRGEPPGRRGTWRRTLRDALAGTEQDFTRGPVGRAILLLAVPMILEMSMESVFAVVDMFFVARLPDGTRAVAAVGLTEAVLTLVYAVGVGLGMGATALVARRTGERDLPGQQRAAAQALWLGLLVAVAIGLPGGALAGEILSLMGAEASVRARGATYATIMFGGSASIVLLFLLSAVFRGAGDAAVAMRALLLANGLNIVLDPCLIFGWGPFPAMGLDGAAVATNTGRGVGVVYLLTKLLRGRNRVRLAPGRLAPAPPVMATLVSVSAGGVGQFLVATASWIFLMRLVAPFGSAAVAGYTIAIRILAVTFLPAWGLANAAATLVGQNLGAGQPDRAERSVRIAAAWCAGGLGLAALGTITWTPTLVGVFTGDAETAGHAVRCLRTVALGYAFYALGMVAIQALNGAGDTRTPTLINLLCFWLLQIPLAWFLTGPLAFGPFGVFVAELGAEISLAAVGVLAFRSGRWKSRRL